VLQGVQAATLQRTLGWKEMGILVSFRPPSHWPQDIVLRRMSRSHDGFNGLMIWPPPLMLSSPSCGVAVREVPAQGSVRQCTLLHLRHILYVLLHSLRVMFIQEPTIMDVAVAVSFRPPSHWQCMPCTCRCTACHPLHASAAYRLPASSC